MKIERLKKNNIWKWIGVTVVISIIVFIVTFKGTRAKYRYTASFPAVQGTINYKSGDISVLAIKLQQEDGTYLDSEDFPTSGYTLNTEESYCVRSVEGEGQVPQDVTLSYENNRLIMDNLTKKGTKCFLYFDKDPCSGGVACNAIMAQNTVDTSRKNGSFTGVFTTNTAGKIFEGPADDSGSETYYFAGANPSNWVKFGKEGTSDIYWRIIRINGDGTVRMIYNGTSTATTGTGTQISNDGGTTTAYVFNSSSYDNAYVGYMYGSRGASSYSATHTNTNSSYAKQQVDTWYNTNLNKTGIKEHIDTNAGFCGDRSIDTGNGYGTNKTYYMARNRLLTNKTPSLLCTNSNDLYTVSTASRGNKALTYPVGLITADEVAYAGGVDDINNTSYWLYTNQNYWTMSPLYMTTSGYARVFRLYLGGSLSGNYDVCNSYGVRPVINLKADTVFSSGDGTSSNPFVVK